MIMHHDFEQGSEDWFSVRKGVVTGSRFKDCREKLKDGRPSKACIAYAMDTARERVGGTAPAKFQNSAMRMGTEQEPLARLAYERLTGNLVEEVGFFTDENRMFGVSPDGLIGEDGVLEIKTMVSSDTLFKAVADGDLSEYVDQCLGYLWLLDRKWVDLVLWAPDLDLAVIRRIDRHESEIEKLESDLIEFSQVVYEFEIKLNKAIEREKNK